MATQTQHRYFAEDQQFRQWWVWGLMLGILLLLLGIEVSILVGARNEEGSLQAILGVGAGIVVLAGVAALLFLMKLSVRLDDEVLHVRFFPLVKRDIRLEEIARWEARTYRPILEYGGWGIRCSWKGMAYNVSGNRGVQLEFTNGRRLLIGSQRPEELAAAIGRARGHA